MRAYVKWKARLKIRHIVIAAVFLLIVGASPMFFLGTRVKIDTEKITLRSIDDVPKEYWIKLAEKRIFFGHKSVGANIVDGINNVIKQHDYIKLNIIETSNPADFRQPIFAHSSVGRNTEPDSKIESFRDIMNSGVGEKVDIAFFKFCFVDVRRDAKPREILDDYKALMQDMEGRYPQTRFLHVTIPLTSGPRGVKGRSKEYVKLLIGRPRTGDLDANAMRQNYNTLLNDAYSETRDVFDLALIESVNPSGLGCYSDKGTQKVPVLAPEYTEDGGHLNDQGSRKVAEQLLITLAEVANKP